MRGFLALIAIIVLLLIVAVATGFLNINQTKTAELPKVEVKGGQAPAFDANVGAVDVGTKNETVKVPKVEVDTKNTTVKLPTIDVKTANETSNK
jgi:beta-lactam-binding protein with PASTA domain